MSDLKSRVMDIIAERTDKDVGDIQPEQKFIDDLGTDSLDVAEMAMQMEDEFDVNFPDEELQKIQTVGDLVSYIEENAG